MNRGRIISIASIFTPVAIGLTIGLAAQSSGGASASTRDAATGSASAAHAATTTALTASATAPKFILVPRLHASKEPPFHAVKELILESQSVAKNVSRGIMFLASECHR